MWIKHLTVNHCRSLEDISLEFSPELNLIIGPNASGKTSLLESLSILSSGRSFRTTHISEVISHNQTSVLVAAGIIDDDFKINIGIEKSTAKTKIRINKKDIFSQAELSSHLPITIIHPNSIDLITGPPSLRRSYIDWIVFYLYPDFHLIWKKYQHILKQRNLCLKYPKHYYALDKWTEELVSLQPRITAHRTKAVALLVPILKHISDSLLNGINIDIEFHSGFSKDVDVEIESLLEYYQSKRDYDLKQKRTSVGVHRADIKIMIDSKPALHSASRGQLKLLAITLLLAQSDTITGTSQKKGMLLIDDLAAELDNLNREILLKYLSTLKKQLIVTSTNNIQFSDMEFKMFHVKHGGIRES